MTIYAKWVGRKPTSWRIRYIDDQGRVLAQEDTGNDNLFTVLFRYGKLIPDYAVDYESKNLTLSSDQMNLLEFIYTYRVKTNWVTEDGTPIKERVYGTFGPEVFDGYVYLSTSTAINGGYYTHLSLGGYLLYTKDGRFVQYLLVSMRILCIDDGMTLYICVLLIHK